MRAKAKTVHRGKSLLVVEFRAESETSKKLIAQGMATAFPLPRKESAETGERPAPRRGGGREKFIEKQKEN